MAPKKEPIVTVAEGGGELIIHYATPFRDEHWILLVLTRSETKRTFATRPPPVWEHLYVADMIPCAASDHGFHPF